MANRNLFNSIKVNPPRRSEFDLSHDVKLTGNMGNLIPILNMETVPGDEFDLSSDSLIRFAPMIAPVLHRMDCTIHYFFVPNRILWRNWDDFISRKNTNLVHPYVDIAGTHASRGEGSLWDYMGFPINMGSVGTRVNPFPFAAYQKIYNEYYRDQNLVAPIIGEDELLIDGNNASNFLQLIELRKRAWMHDYFASALPSPQLGPGVNLPLGNVQFGIDTVPVVRKSTDGLITQYNSTTAGEFALVGDADVSGLNNELRADIRSLNANVGATSINDLRRATKLQEYLELLMRSGRRMKEYIMAVFGVDPGDARVNRPEYITGVRTPVMISEVLNTAGVSGSNPQAAMAGHGVANYVSADSGHYFCREHGWIIGIMSVMPQPAYQDGVHRSLHRRRDSLDYYIPQFANIGEQEIYLSELRGASANPDTVFGYVPRYSEYKYMYNRVAGNFRSSLDFWHLGRKFANDPALNQTFIEMDSSAVDRIFAVKPTGSTHSIYAQIGNRIRAIRPMPKFGTPHF